MRLRELTESPIKLSTAGREQALAWIEKVYNKFPDTFQGNHVMSWGEGEAQQLAMFELVPSFSKRGAVDVKWFQAYPLRQGVGSRAMQVLKSLAQEDGITLTLYPWDKGQVSQAKLIKFYKSHGFKPAMKGSKNMAWEPEIDEGWKDQLANVAAAGAIAAAGTGGMMAKQAVSDYFNKPSEPTATVQQVQQAPKVDVKKFAPQAKQQTPAAPKKIVVRPITDNPLENTLLKVAKAEGLKGAELAAFMAQCAHETMDFRSLVEFGGSLDFRKYDPKYAPKKAKALGNKHVGDGMKFKGRGFIQITGRYNYKKAGEELGLPLEKHPELVQKPDVAAKVAVWFWKHRVQPNVDNFHDVNQVTKPINPNMRGLEDRKENFKAYISAAEKPLPGSTSNV